MKEIYFVTGNKGKVASAQRHFTKYNITLLHGDYDVVEPDVNDVLFISKQKVLQAYQFVKKPCIALDSGFYIPNYPNQPNFPGAFPKRELLEKIGLQGLLSNMKTVTNRECYFKECLSYYNGKKIKQFLRDIPGSVSTEIRGQNKDKKWSELWGVFIPAGKNKVIAEMSQEEYEQWGTEKPSVFDDFAKWFLRQK